MNEGAVIHNVVLLKSFNYDLQAAIKHNYTSNKGTQFGSQIVPLEANLIWKHTFHCTTQITSFSLIGEKLPKMEKVPQFGLQISF